MAQRSTSAIPNITRGLLAMTDTTSTISKVSMAQKSTSKAPPAVAMASVLLHPGYDAMKDTLAAESSLTSLHIFHIFHMDIRVNQALLQLDALTDGPSVPTAGCLRD